MTQSSNTEHARVLLDAVLGDHTAHGEAGRAHFAVSDRRIEAERHRHVVDDPVDVKIRSISFAPVMLIVHSDVAA